MFQDHQMIDDRMPLRNRMPHGKSGVPSCYKTISVSMALLRTAQPATRSVVAARREELDAMPLVVLAWKPFSGSEELQHRSAVWGRPTNGERTSARGRSESNRQMMLPPQPLMQRNLMRPALQPNSAMPFAETGRDPKPRGQIPSA